MKRVATMAGPLAVVAIVAAAGFWAGRVALAPPTDPLADEPAQVPYEVVEQTIGQSLQFAAVAAWQTAPLARAGAPGGQ